MDKIALRIRELRKERKMTQTRLAELLATTQDTVSLWERGKSYPDIPSLIRLCAVFEVSADFLLGLTDY